MTQVIGLCLCMLLPPHNCYGHPQCMAVLETVYIVFSQSGSVESEEMSRSPVFLSYAGKRSIELGSYAVYPSFGL